jgi:hypothetical protein
VLPLCVLLARDLDRRVVKPVEHLGGRSEGKLGVEVVDRGGVEGEIRAIHGPCRADLASEPGLCAPDRVGHQAQHGWRDVARRRAASGGALHHVGELVEGEVLGSADLERSPPGGRVEDRSFDQGGDVADGDEVDRVLTAAEHERPAGPRGGLLEEFDPQFQERGRAHDRARDAAAGGSLLSGVLHAKQLHRTVGRGTDRGEQDEPRARGGGGVDQVGVAVAVDCRERVAGRVIEPVHGGDDHVGADEGRLEPLAVAHVAPRQRDMTDGRRPGARWIAREDPDRMPAVGQALDEKGAEPAGATGDEDHCRPPGITCRLTA